MALLRKLGGKLGLPMLTSPPHDKGERVILYSSSVVGLGHTARICRLAMEIKRQRPTASVLLISDCKPEVIRGLAPDVAFMKLPHYEFAGGGSGGFREVPAQLSISKQALRDLRANVILATVVGFQPTALLFDTMPHGKRDELLPTLKFLQAQGIPPRRLLMMRDIPAPPAEDAKINASKGERGALSHEYYDRILIAGDPAFFPAGTELQWPADLQRKASYVGYIIPVIEPPAMRRSGREIVVSFGGGWECRELALPIVAAWRQLRTVMPDLRLYLSTGPAASTLDLEAIASAAGEDRTYLELHQFDGAFGERLMAADVALLQAGSTLFQILNTDIPTLVYARDWKSTEQQERAQRAARFPGISLLKRADFDAVATLTERLRAALEGPRVRRETGIKLDGLREAARAVLGEAE